MRLPQPAVWKDSGSLVKNSNDFFWWKLVFSRKEIKLVHVTEGFGIKLF